MNDNEPHDGLYTRPRLLSQPERDVLDQLERYDGDEAHDRERMRRDGCDCPSWVRRCVHFGERRLWLLDRDSAYEALQERGAPVDGGCCSECGLPFIHPGPHYYVVTGFIAEPVCACRINLDYAYRFDGDFADLDAALRAFHNAEARLRVNVDDDGEHGASETVQRWERDRMAGLE